MKKSIGTLILLVATLPRIGAGAGPVPAPRPNEPEFSTFKIVVDRNIFDPNRRPHVVAQADQPIVDSFTLAGTMSYQKGLFAVFDGNTPDYRKVLEPGGSIAGYSITNVTLNKVTLVSGTNELELTVGMQMRRNEDGRWSVGEGPEGSFASRAPGSQHRRSSRRSPSAASGGAESAAPDSLAQQPDMADAGPTPPDAGVDMTNSPAAPEGDANDAVARMIRRRAQELNGNDSPSNP